MLPAILPVFGLPLIIQTLPGLQVLAPYVVSQVAGLHRASPSATLDKSFVTSLLYHVIGASRSAGLATYNALSPQRIDIRLGSGHHKLRRHHLRYAPIAIARCLGMALIGFPLLHPGSKAYQEDDQRVRPTQLREITNSSHVFCYGRLECPLMYLPTVALFDCV
jgi:hypothetical protein